MKKEIIYEKHICRYESKTTTEIEAPDFRQVHKKCASVKIS